MSTNQDAEPNVEVRPKTLHFEITWGKLFVAACVGLAYGVSPLVNTYWGYSDNHNGAIFASKTDTDKSIGLLWQKYNELRDECHSNSDKLKDISRAAK